MPTFGQVIDQLRKALSDPELLSPAFSELEALVYNDETEYQQLPEHEQEVLAELACDLEYFEPNPEWRKEAACFYGPERAIEEIRRALVQLSVGGASKPDIS